MPPNQLEAGIQCWLAEGCRDFSPSEIRLSQPLREIALESCTDEYWIIKIMVDFDLASS